MDDITYSTIPTNTQTLQTVAGSGDRRRWSLLWQLVAVITIIVLTVVLGITVVSILRESQSFRSELEERAITTIDSIDAATIDLLYYADVDRIETIADNFAETSGTLVVRFYDATGRVVVTTDALVQNRTLNADPYGEFLLAADGIQMEWANDRLIAGRRIAVGNQVLGAVRLELSTASLVTRLQINVLQGIVAAVLASAFGAVAVFFVSRSMVSPITTLVNRTKIIAAGDLEKPIYVQGGSSEMAQLANAIEHMRSNLQIIYANLEQRVAERTVELQEARDEALAAQRIANENSRLKSEFLATMSHELRTPMNAIEGFTSIMLKRMAGVEYNDKTEHYLTRVQANSQRLLNLINDFLDLSRIESGRMELASLPMSPVEMSQKWRDNLSVLAENKGLTFEVNVDPNLPKTMYGDEESLSKIVINLVGNAIKFTEAGSVTLSLQRRGDQMELEVTDTGIGIPAHAREFVFDEFRQVDQSSKRQHGGTGLGLAIVQKLARVMGGTVTVQSQVGIGSTFTVMLPIRLEEQLVESAM